jgi:putative endonuclease
VGVADAYGLRRLVYFEPPCRNPWRDPAREKHKHWPRAWKVRLILDANPAWDDLYEHLA